MKIALIDPALFTWPYDKALADGLRTQGHQVTLYTKFLTANEPGAGQADVVQLFYPLLNLSVFSRLPRKVLMLAKGSLHLFGLVCLLFVLAAKKPDIIHFQWTPLAVLDRWFIPLFRYIAPCVLTVHDSSPFNNNPGAKLQRVGAIAIMHSFDRLIVHTAHARSRLLAYGLPEGKISIIAHGPLDNQLEGMTNSPLPLRPDGPVTLLLFGKLKPYKGCDIALRALALLPAELRQQARLRVVGKAEMDTAPLFALAEELGVTNQVQWDLRFVSEAEMPEIFAGADIMLMPYREIDASGVLMVALTIGRPIVASRMGLFAELLQDGVHGALVTPEDPAALAVALGPLIAKPELRQQMAGQVRELLTSIPTWPQIGAQTTALYQLVRAKATKS